MIIKDSIFLVVLAVSDSQLGIIGWSPVVLFPRVMSHKSEKFTSLGP